jgi:hypothetical protein
VTAARHYYQTATVLRVVGVLTLFGLPSIKQLYTEKTITPKKERKYRSSRKLMYPGNIM